MNRRFITYLITGLVTAFLLANSGQFVWAQGRVSLPQNPSAEPSLSSLDIGKQVYQKLPDLPLENQYISLKSGEVSPANTLASRILRYHLYTKGRAPNYRLDWKLTLADYLGANEVMEDARYPGADALTVNPIDGDRAVIKRFTRAQREQFIQVMVSLFSRPSNLTPPSTRTGSPQPSSGTSPNPVRSLPAQPKPGDARLLMP